nr:retrovirus-related Pol polyprotein from transposon TNT 1-94 [Tanacetum cinerariifolium]
MFRINPFKTSREEKHVPNKVRASFSTNPITVSQPHVFTKKDVNSDSNGLSSTGVDNTKIKRPQPRSDTKNNRVPSMSKSSCNKNKGVEQCLISVNHNVCLLYYVNGKTSRGKKQKANVSINEKQKKQQPKLKKTKKVGFIEILATPKPRQFCDSNLEVAFRRNACFVRNLEGVDLLSGNGTTNLYTINLHEMASASPICLMARTSSTKSWLWHQRLSHLNFDTINDLAKNDLVSGLPKFNYHMEHLCPSYILLLHVSEALCYPKNDREDIRKLGAKGDIGFFIRYSADSCAYRVFIQRTKKTMEIMNVSFDKLSAMAFEQSSSKLGLQSMTSRQISLRLELTYAPSTITTQQPTEGELDLLFKAMHDDYIGGQLLASLRTDSAAQAHQVHQTSTTSTSIADTAPTPTNSSSQATIFSNTTQDVDGLNTQQQHA